jgi:hypothetical protein
MKRVHHGRDLLHRDRGDARSAPSAAGNPAMNACSVSCAIQHSFLLDEADHSDPAPARLEVREDERAACRAFLRIAFHHFERGAHHGREVDLVDHQQVGLGDAGPPLRGSCRPRRRRSRRA